MPPRADPDSFLASQKSGAAAFPGAGGGRAVFREKSPEHRAPGSCSYLPNQNRTLLLPGSLSAIRRPPLYERSTAELWLSAS